MIIAAKIARYMLVAFIIYTVSIIIPEYYSLAFDKSVQSTRVFFSPIKKDFLETKSYNHKYQRFDAQGNILSKEEFESLTPFYSYRQLFYRGELPDSVNGVAVDAHIIRDNNFFLAIRAININKYQIQLFPLLESKPDGPDLNMPEDFYRVTNNLSFINCASNKIKSTLSDEFNTELVKNGFSFPSKNIFGNPSTMKPFDDGYFIVDSKNNLFHLMRIHNKPYCKKVELPEGIKIKYILVQELELKEFHCIMVTEDSRVFLVLFDNYKLVELPIKGYDYSTMKLEFLGNPLYRQINFLDDGKVNSVVTDRNYKIIKTHSVSWETNEDAAMTKIFKYVFPFSLSLSEDNSAYINFYFKYSGWSFLVGNIISLIIGLIIFNKYNKRKKSTQIIDLLIIAVTGLYGLIATALIRDEN